MKNGGRVPWNVTAICENIQDLVSNGKTPYEKRFGLQFKGSAIPFGAMVEISPYFCQRPVGDCISSARKTYQEYSSIIYHTRVESGKETFLVADIEEVEKMEASEIHAWRLNAKEVLAPKNGEQFVFPVADGTVKLWKRSGSENIQLNPGQPRPREKNKEIFQENQTGLHHHFKTHRWLMSWKFSHLVEGLCTQGSERCRSQEI